MNINSIELQKLGIDRMAYCVELSQLYMQIVTIPIRQVSICNMSNQNMFYASGLFRNHV